jgi:hypothetical protein
LAFSHPIFTTSLIDPQSQNPQHNTVMPAVLWQIWARIPPIYFFPGPYFTLPKKIPGPEFTGPGIPFFTSVYVAQIPNREDQNNIMSSWAGLLTYGLSY